MRTPGHTEQETGTSKTSPGTAPNSTPNYFADAAAAERYHRARPLYHTAVVRWICEATGGGHFRRVLDVGCGSGHSTVALRAMADEVVGVDASEGMLEQAQAAKGIRYELGRAEELNFANGAFELVTVGSALHWFARDRFYAACRRVLAEDGALVVYNDHFTAHMQGVVKCKQWMRTRFVKRFPRPRGMRDIDESEAVQGGFEVEQRGSFSHVVSFTRAQFVAYLMTRSSTLASIDSGRETAESVADWLNNELAAIVPADAGGEFVFKCNLWLLRRIEDEVPRTLQSNIPPKR
jgi:SAM-dependent methyltransferase